MLVQTITYNFIGGTAAQMNKVNVVCQEWMKYANINFTQVSSGGQMRISFNPRGGSWSYIGSGLSVAASDAATMNLSVLDADEATSTQRERGLILHEFGHALGMLHEHRSPARGGKLTLNDPRESSLPAK